MCVKKRKKNQRIPIKNIRKLFVLSSDGQKVQFRCGSITTEPRYDRTNVDSDSCFRHFRHSSLWVEYQVKGNKQTIQRDPVGQKPSIDNNANRCNILNGYQKAIKLLEYFIAFNSIQFHV